MKDYVANNFKAINYQYAVGQSLPSWGDLEGCSTGMATDNSSIISQGFLYAPFGEIISEYTPGWETDRIPKYAFNAKEFDEENGMYYYSARYYAPPTFISRDPKFEKYPSISPYTYCANNPVILVDPTGEEIEFNGLIDIVYVFCESIFNKDFRNQVKELKKSEETYVFKFNNVAENNFTTDGEKLFINYSNIEKDSKTGKILEGSERLGWNLFTELRHETKHGIQFEHGEIGFKFNEKTSNWAPLFYDVYDELEASIAGAGTFSWVTPTQRSEFQSKSRDEKMSLIKKTYPEIEQDFNLHNPGRGRKDSEYFMLPYKPQ